MNEMRKLMEAVAEFDEAGPGRPGPKTFQQRGERSMDRDQWKELLKLVHVVMDEAIDRAEYDENQEKCQLHKQDRNNIAFHFMEAWDSYNL